MEQDKKLKNFIKTTIREFLNENVENKISDSFIINVKYDVGYADIDTKGILLSALQKTYKGWSDIAIVNGYSFDYTIKNSDVKLKLVESKYYSETFEVTFNENRDEYDELDNVDYVFKYVSDIIKKITHYTYRSIHTMDKKQKTDIKILSISKVGG